MRRQLGEPGGFYGQDVAHLVPANRGRRCRTWSHVLGRAAGSLNCEHPVTECPSCSSRRTHVTQVRLATCSNPLYSPAGVMLGPHTNPLGPCNHPATAPKHTLALTSRCRSAQRHRSRPTGAGSGTARSCGVSAAWQPLPRRQQSAQGGTPMHRCRLGLGVEQRV